MREGGKNEPKAPEKQKPFDQLKLSHIEIDGNREMILDGCKGILEYGDETIRILTESCVVAVSGDGLLIKSYNDSQIMLTGRIITLDFS